MIYKKFLASVLALSLSVCTIACADKDTTQNESNKELSSLESSRAFEEESREESFSVGDSESILEESSDYISEESKDEDTSESSESSEISIEESFDEPSGEISEESSEAESESEGAASEESSDESIDPALADTFVIYGPEISYELSWEDGGLELYNTDFRMSDVLSQKLKNQIASFANAQSIMLIELDTNMTFAYSKDTKIATASSIKGPVGLYVNKCIDAGIISWDTYKSYQPHHFQANSTGSVQHYGFGTSFSVETLMDYMIRISDNQAYLMLKELVGAKNFNYMMKTLGCSEIIAPGSNWGYITAKEMAAAWREIYFYSLESESGAGLFDRYMHAQYNYIWRSIPQYEAAHKSGWSGKAFNDAGVVFADGHEYVLVVLCGRSGVEDPRSQYQFTAITRLLAELMVEYNTYKTENGL